MSGLLPGYEDAPNRRERLRALWKATVLLIRRELKWSEQEIELKIKNAKCKMEGGTLEFCAGERSIYWDPSSEVDQQNGNFTIRAYDDFLATQGRHVSSGLSQVLSISAIWCDNQGHLGDVVKEGCHTFDAAQGFGGIEFSALAEQK